MKSDNRALNNVLLISGSFTSANFNVMLSVLRSLGDVHIHAISANNEKDRVLPLYDDVTYYHIFNWRKSFVYKLRKMPMKKIDKIAEFILSKTTALYDTIATSVYEREIYHCSKKIIQDYDISSIFTVCFPFYAHRIGLKLRKKIGVKWLQFWVDPYSTRKIGGLLWWIAARHAERDLLKEASYIYALPEVFNGDKLIEPFINKLILFEIPYLDKKDITTSTKNVVFAGTFIKNVRDPLPVFKLLMSILDSINEDIIFHFYIKDKKKYLQFTKESNGRICFHDFVSHDELYQILGDSYMLLNIGNASSVQMPSKTVEYVSFRKPLLFFYQDDKDSSLRYLDEYPDICKIKVNEDPASNITKLVHFFRTDHPLISYDDLMKVECYKHSTPDYIKTILKETI